MRLQEENAHIWFSSNMFFVTVKSCLEKLITAAPTERNWSLRGAIHTKVRNRLDVEMASKLTFIKHNLLLEHKDLFSRVKSSQENESEEAESEQEMEATEGNSEINDLLYVDDLLFESD
uniref:HAT C-terminal dimerisation domain-containing protein n=1 Tax=Ditylenchus dipsaci TaxID=166011 RepID=A0A915DCD0_9BILA